MKKMVFFVMLVFAGFLFPGNTIAQNTKTVDESIQLPIFRFVGWGNRIPAAALKNIQEVSADLYHLNINTPYKVEKFTVLAVHTGNATITKIDCMGNLMSDALKAAFQSLQPGDYIIVKDIYLSSENRQSFKTQDAVFMLR